MILNVCSTTIKKFRPEGFPVVPCGKAYGQSDITKVSSRFSKKLVRKNLWNLFAENVYKLL